MKHIEHKVTLEKLYILLLLIVFGGIVLQAPISVGFGTLLPSHALLIKAWAEFLMAIASLLVLILLYRKRQFKLFKDPIIRIILGYITLHLLLLPIFWKGTSASFTGLIVDLRYVVFFGLTYVALRLYPQYKNLFIKVGIAGALIVSVFALLQVSVLPVDILKYIGYNTHTIAPYLTVDQNVNYVRINSTLRGPNPLGAYAGIVLAVLLAALLKKPVITTKKRVLMALVALGAVVSLWASYSRSAVGAAIIAMIIVGLSASYKRVSLKVWGIGIFIIGITILVVIGLGGSSFISNIVLHDNPDGGSTTTSDAGHITSLASGIRLFATHPFGDGVGSTGSPSLSTKSPLIIEDQYLLTAHESGWIGIVLFLSLFIYILRKLWQRRQEWLALGVFASGIGLALIGLLLPVWADDTVAIIWWGLAGIVLGVQHDRR